MTFLDVTYTMDSELAKLTRQERQRRLLNKLSDKENNMKYLAVSFASLEATDVSSYDGGATFNGYTVYTYTVEDEDLVDDATHAIVVGNVQKSLALVRILKVKDEYDGDYNGKFKSVIATASTSRFIERGKKRKRKEELEKQLQRMAEKKLRETQFRTVLADDEEALAMIKELDELK